MMNPASRPSSGKPHATPTPSSSRSISIKPGAIPRPALEVCAKLHGAGHKAWLAGGCVRDLLLGRSPRDWDIVTDAPIGAIRELFPRHLEVGVAFGIVKLLPPNDGIDIAIFRRESGYSDRRRPDTVEPAGEREDACRRDFTVNALFLDPLGATVVDYAQGLKDLERKLIRTVGAPEERFSEDALRVLRAARFSAQLGFRIAPHTLDAMKKCAPLLRDISRERVREELFRILEGPRPVQGLETLLKAGMWEQVFGVRKTSAPADYRALRFSGPPGALAWICALAVTGMLGDPVRKPGELVRRVTARLRLSNEESRVLSMVVSVFQASRIAARGPKRSSPLDWIELASRRKAELDLAKRFIRRARGVTIEEKERAIGLIEQSQRWASVGNAPSRLPSAKDLLREGMREGPELGRELRARQWKSFWELTR